MPDQLWHSPKFERILCGSMTDRERLGLPDRHIEPRFAGQWPKAYEAVRRLAPEALARRVEDPVVSLAERLAAGNLLALLGDPRIDTLFPVMIAIEGGRARIGLEPEELPQVAQRYAALGLHEDWLAKECPAHAVELRTFRIGRYPVTNQEYQDFLLDTGYPEIPTSWVFRRYPIERSNHPVFTLTPEAADAYAAWLSARTGRRFRLPSEAEWEVAAAGPRGWEFPWGPEFEADRCNTAETGLFGTSPVGAFPLGNAPCGACDMAGNVEEYVRDGYAPYPGARAIEDHLVEANGGAYRVARGGGFARFRDLARTRRRHGPNPRSATYAMGFRLAEAL